MHQASMWAMGVQMITGIHLLLPQGTQPLVGRQAVNKYCNRPCNELQGED